MPQEKEKLTPTKTATEKEPAESWHHRPLWVGILSVVATILLTAPATLWLNNYTGRLRTLSYYVTSSAGLFPKPDLGKQLTITIDGKPVDNVSTVNVYLVNNSDTDFEDVPIELTFSNPSGGPTPALIRAKAMEFPSTASLPLDGSAQNQPTSLPASEPLRLNYTVKVVNRSKLSAFSGEFAFEGAVAPSVKLGLHKKGVEAHRVEIGASEKKDSVTPQILFGAVLILLMGALAVGKSVYDWGFRSRITHPDDPPDTHLEDPHY